MADQFIFVENPNFSLATDLFKDCIVHGALWSYFDSSKQEHQPQVTVQQTVTASPSVVVSVLSLV